MIAKSIVVVKFDKEGAVIERTHITDKKLKKLLTNDLGFHIITLASRVRSSTRCGSVW